MAPDGMHAGARLRPYEILEPLGKGGMGELWLAQDTRLGRKAAVDLWVMMAIYESARERRPVKLT
jgi:serine/threonine protein kinase